MQRSCIFSQHYKITGANVRSTTTFLAAVGMARLLARRNNTNQCASTTPVKKREAFCWRSGLALYWHALALVANAVGPRLTLQKFLPIFQHCTDHWSVWSVQHCLITYCNTLFFERLSENLGVHIYPYRMFVPTITFYNTIYNFETILYYCITLNYLQLWDCLSGGLLTYLFIGYIKIRFSFG